METPVKSKSEDMSASAQTMLREYAGQRWPTMNHKGRMSRLATILNWGHRRVRTVYQNEMGARLRADEMAAIEALRAEANKSEFAALEDRLAALEAAFARIDPEHVEPHLAAFREAINGGRAPNVDRSSEEDRRWIDISG